MGVTARFRSVVRAALGMPDDPGMPPDLVRLGLYRARVDGAAADGSALDVTPEDTRISAAKNVPVRVGIPGAVAVVKPGAIVLLGWEKGDPARPYCVPSWEAAAGVSKLVLNADLVELVAEAGSDFIALATKVNDNFNTLFQIFDGLAGAASAPIAAVFPGTDAFYTALKAVLASAAGAGSWPLPSVAAQKSKAV